MNRLEAVSLSQGKLELCTFRQDGRKFSILYQHRLTSTGWVGYMTLEIN